MQIVTRPRKLFYLLLLSAFVLGCNSKSNSNEIVCGGSMNFACPADMYCNSKENCGGIDRNGVCTVRPTQCKIDNQPVCGCDGQTYSSPCLAAAKGVSQKSIGECSVPIAVEADSAEEMSAEENLDDGITGE
jgi:hypothetical protein